MTDQRFPYIYAAHHLDALYYALDIRWTASAKEAFSLYRVAVYSV
jgi:hypothetical protein